MTDPLNVVMLMLILFTLCGGLALSQSPDALDRLGRNLRARAAALRAARAAYRDAWTESLYEQEFYANREKVRELSRRS